MWYAVQVMSGKEEETCSICKNLLGKDAYNGCFLIRCNKDKKYCGKWHRVSMIMFPGYIFIDTDNPKKVYEGLKNIPGLTKILGRENDYFIPIEIKEQLFLASLIDEKFDLNMSNGLIVDDSIIITDGPLIGKEATIKKIDRHKRTALVSIEMFGRAMEIKVGLEIISKS